MKLSISSSYIRGAMLAVFGWLFVLSQSAQADVFTDVPEAKNYKLVYSLDIPLKGGFLTKLPPYSINRSKLITGSIQRIAYYLSLETTAGKRQFVYVSMDAFTQNLEHIGVPSGVVKKTFQQTVQNMNVVSNVKGIHTGTKLSGGNLEFWPTNYVPTNSKRVPNASDLVYDVGDQPVSSGSYGSMQIHNHNKSQTLFAYNRWGTPNAVCDLGIGNNTVKHSDGKLHRDWTFRVNCGAYKKRVLQILVLSGPPPKGSSLTFNSPKVNQVFQRQKGNKATVAIRGNLHVQADTADVRAISVRGGKSTSWKPLQLSNKLVSGSLELQGGWYRLEVRLKKTGKVIDTILVKQFGVGEVFIIAGQSNSANSGGTKMKATDPRVTNYGFGTWVPAEDPMLIATGSGGSPWPVMGDLLAKQWNIPIGIISVGWGGTSIKQWLPTPTGNLYPRLKDALKVVGKYGARAILWHQGESDTIKKTTTANYVKDMVAVISQSRKDAGWSIPWYIAGVAYMPNASAQAMKQIRNAQDLVVAGHPDNHAGPTTDDMTGSKWRYDRVHFGKDGLIEHAKRWVKVLKLPSCQGLPNIPDECPVTEPTPEPTPEPAPEPVQEQKSDAGSSEPTDASPDKITPEPKPEPALEPTPEPKVESLTEPVPDTSTTDSNARDVTSGQPDTSDSDKQPSSGCQCSSNEPVQWFFVCFLVGLFVRRRKR